jgi:hypothetical protein
MPFAEEHLDLLMTTLDDVIGEVVSSI